MWERLGPIADEPRQRDGWPYAAGQPFSLSHQARRWARDGAGGDAASAYRSVVRTRNRAAHSGEPTTAIGKKDMPKEKVDCANKRKEKISERGAPADAGVNGRLGLPLVDTKVRFRAGPEIEMRSPGTVASRRKRASCATQTTATDSKEDEEKADDSSRQLAERGTQIDVALSTKGRRSDAGRCGTTGCPPPGRRGRHVRRGCPCYGFRRPRPLKQPGHLPTGCGSQPVGRLCLLPALWRVVLHTDDANMAYYASDSRGKAVWDFQMSKARWLQQVCKRSCLRALARCPPPPARPACWLSFAAGVATAIRTRHQF